MKTHKQLMQQALSDPEVKTLYDEYTPEFELLESMLQARKNAHLTQLDIAKRMNTKASAITRLESSLTSGKVSPSLATLKRYAAAVDGHLEVRIVPNEG